MAVACFRIPMNICKCVTNQFTRRMCSKIPSKAVSSLPIRDPNLPKIKIDKETVQLLEKLALVKFSDEEGIEAMEKTITFVEPLKDINTEGIEPMVSLLEDRTIYLREDNTEKTNRHLILKNATKIEDDYFVAPPGNVPFNSGNDS